ncbi:MAG: hypothetical protein EA424_15195 [Planctomycetaceae bacterium]|nr:MAG: hypothetical protein EA424_15195 [Planctomycetaceae bacterium]
MTRSIEKARERVTQSGYQPFSDFPCVPSIGATETELAQLEGDLGSSLPSEYRTFLALCRYLKIDDGCEIGGFDHEGVYVAEIPCVSDQRRPGVPYLVFANDWRFADGDQLMFDLSDSNNPVVASLHEHEHGPLFEVYAPSFSLALWRPPTWHQNPEPVSTGQLARNGCSYNPISSTGMGRNGICPNTAASVRRRKSWLSTSASPGSWSSPNTAFSSNSMCCGRRTIWPHR